MLFPTATFAIFFAIVFVLNWLLIDRRPVWKVFMLCASYVFYGWWDWRFLGLIAASTVVNHLLALAMQRAGERNLARRLLLALAVIFNLCLLGFFKYYSFFVLSVYQACALLGLKCSLPLLDVVLPVGISFFTFQALSYVIDVYRREIPPARRMIDFGVYLAFFPQLVAGPIVRAKHLIPQITGAIEKNRIDIGRAFTLIMAGLFKKMVIATYLAGEIVDPVFGLPSEYGAFDTMAAIYAYMIQIYCDFSAYSDIAIGVGLLLGFRLPLNFNAPYFALSLSDFWTRWHISLSTWLRDYLFVPLGGMRRSGFRIYSSITITFLLGGLWHGASWNFVLWGALNGIYLAVERFFRILSRKAARRRGVKGHRSHSGPARFAMWFLAFHVVYLLIVFFRVRSIQEAWEVFGRFSVSRAPELVTPQVCLAAAVGFCMQFLDGERPRRIWLTYERMHPVLQGLIAALAITFILALGPKGVAPFIYFQF